MADDDIEPTAGAEAEPSGDPTPSPETGAEGQTEPPGGQIDGVEPDPSLREMLDKQFAGKPADPAPPAPPAPPADIPGAPNSWGGGAKGHWAALPQEVRDEVLRREDAFNKGFSGQGEKLRAAEDAAAHIGGVLRPFEDYIKANGGLSQALTGLLETGRAVTTGAPAQRAAAVADVLARSGIGVRGLTEFLEANPSVLEGVQQGRPVNQPQQPVGLTAQDVQKAVQEAMAGQQRKQVEDATLAKMREFEAGKPEHFHAVKEAMFDAITAAVGAGRVPDVKAIYEQAIWGNADIRAKLLAAEKGKPDETKQAAKKKDAASSVTGAPGGQQRRDEKGRFTVREALESAFDEHGL